MNTRTFITSIATVAIVFSGATVASAQDAPAPNTIEFVAPAPEYTVDQIDTTIEVPAEETMTAPSGSYDTIEVSQISDEAEIVDEPTLVGPDGHYNTPVETAQIDAEADVPATDNAALIGGILGGLAGLIALIGGAAALFPQLLAL